MAKEDIYNAKYVFMERHIVFILSVKLQKKGLKDPANLQFYLRINFRMNKNLI